MTKKKEVPKIAKNIKKQRERLNLSQDDLSKRSDLAFHTIAKIETGATTDPRISTMQKIAASFGVTVDELVK